MNKVNWGILSTGKIARTFAKTLNSVEGAACYAVSSRSSEKAAAFAKEFGFSKSYGSSAEMLADPALDAVYIASPMSCHYADAIACMEAGKNVLCEKTVTLNGQQLDTLLELAERKGVLFMEAMWTKCLPVYLQAREWLESGRIGKPQMVKADFVNICEYNEQDRLFRADLGGGALLDLGVYPITFAMGMLGSFPEKITAYSRMKDGVDYDTTILLNYPEGAFASLNCGFDTKSENGAYIVGEKGTIAIESWFFCAQSICLYDSSNRLVERKELPFKCNGYEYEVEEFDRCLAEGLRESTLVPHMSTRSVMTVIDEVKRQIGLKFPGE